MEATGSSRLCPDCGKPLEPRHHEDVVLDACEEHGLWFDPGEYDVLRRKAISGGQRGLQRRKRSARRSGYGEGLADGIQVLSRISLRVRRRFRLRRSSRWASAPAPASARAPGPLGPAAKDRPCPRCRAPMVREVWRDLFRATPDIAVDLCPEHGLWLDPGELDVLLERARIDARRDGRAKVSRADAAGYEEGFRAGSTIHDW